MSFKADLDLNGKTFEVLEFKSQLEQKYDQKGKPTSGVKGGSFYLIIAGTPEDTFAAWITDPTKKNDGTITMYRIDQNSKFKEYKFTGAYITRLIESFIIDDDINLQGRALHSTIPAVQEVYEKVLSFQQRTQMSYIMYCEISAEKVTIDGVDHDNKW
jgi:hypothetical protein